MSHRRGDRAPSLHRQQCVHRIMRPRDRASVIADRPIQPLDRTLTVSFRSRRDRGSIQARVGRPTKLPTRHKDPETISAVRRLRKIPHDILKSFQKRPRRCQTVPTLSAAYRASQRFHLAQANCLGSRAGPDMTDRVMFGAIRRPRLAWLATAQRGLRCNQRIGAARLVPFIVW